MELSVIIPTYNRANYLKAALQSLISQTLNSDSFEVVVIDDGSSDKTEKIANDFSGRLNLKYFRQDHFGVSAARNLGIEKALADKLVFFDDDAIAKGDWLENISRILNQESAITGKVEPIHYNIWRFFAPHYNQGDKPVESPVLLEGNCAFKREVFERIGRFDAKLDYGHEGREFLNRLHKNYRLMYYPEVIIYHDYAFGLRNYFGKQFKFGEKTVYLAIAELSSLNDLFKKYATLKAGKSSDKADNFIRLKRNLLDKVAVGVISRLGNICHFLGAVYGYYKYKKNGNGKS